MADHVEVDRELLDLLVESFCELMGFTQKMEQDFKTRVSSGKGIRLGGEAADDLVAMAQRGGGTSFANLVGRYVNGPDGGFNGRTFKQVCDSVTAR